MQMAKTTRARRVRLGAASLALAAAMRNAGTLIAADTDRGRLSKLAPRAERAGAAVRRRPEAVEGMESSRVCADGRAAYPSRAPASTD